MATDTGRPASDPAIGKILADRDFVVTEAMIDDHFESLALDRSAFDRGETPVPSMIAGARTTFTSRVASSKITGTCGCASNGICALR